MSIIEMVLGGLGALMAVALSGFFAGSILGSGKAEAKARQQRTEENAATVVAAAERKAEVMKEASNVQETVNRMPDDDVDRELRNTWKRHGGG